MLKPNVLNRLSFTSKIKELNHIQMWMNINQKYKIKFSNIFFPLQKTRCNQNILHNTWMCSRKKWLEPTKVSMRLSHSSERLRWSKSPDLNNMGEESLLPPKILSTTVTTNTTSAVTSMLYTNSRKTHPMYQRFCFLHNLLGDTNRQHAPNSKPHSWTGLLSNPVFPHGRGGHMGWHQAKQKRDTSSQESTRVKPSGKQEAAATSPHSLQHGQLQRPCNTVLQFYSIIQWTASYSPSISRQVNFQHLLCFTN